MKTCNKCGIEKPLSQYPKNPSMASGYLNSCKSCTAKFRVRKPRTESQRLAASVQNAAAYAARSEEKKAQVAAYRAANPEKIKASQAAYVSNNRDAIRAQHKDYAQKNSERRKSAAALWRSLNPEKSKATIADWYARNPDAMLIKKQNRRARKFAGGRLSRGIKSKLMLLQRGLCAGCKCRLKDSGCHLDHIIPLARSGANVDTNVQLLCPPCNLGKGAKNPIDWAQENGRLL